MNFRNKYFIAAQTLGAAFIVAILVVACGGGGSSSSGFTQSYISSAGAGDVMQFSIDTANMTYSFKVEETSYLATASGVPAASAVSATESSSGTLTGRNAVGSYNLSASADGFIQGGEVYPLQNGMFVGHVLIPKIGGATIKIPVFGVPNPITTVANLAAIYNYQGFACASRSGGVVNGAIVCASHTGTIMVDALGSFSTCRDGNLAASTPSCTQIGGGTATAPTLTGTLTAVPGKPGVFDFVTNDTPTHLHRGWLFAFKTNNGQNVAVIDHDDNNTPEIFGFGHTVAVSQASVASGQIDGKYFVKNDLGQRHLITVSGPNFSDTFFPSSAGTLQYNQPWTGLVTYQIAADSGVADIATAGAFTYNSNTYPYLLGVGLKY